MSSDRPAKQQWSGGRGRWGEISGFSNGQTTSNSWGAGSSGNTGHFTSVQGHSTTGQMDVQWNSSNRQAGQNQARWWGSRHGQGADSNQNRKVTFLMHSAILLKYLADG